MRIRHEVELRSPHATTVSNRTAIEQQSKSRRHESIVEEEVETHYVFKSVEYHASKGTIYFRKIDDLKVESLRLRIEDTAASEFKPD